MRAVKGSEVGALELRMAIGTWDRHGFRGKPALQLLMGFVCSGKEYEGLM